MRCAFFEAAPDEEAVGESLQIDSLPLDELRECLAEVETAADPRQYTTPIAMDDLDDVRAALGYERINPVRRLVRHARGPGLHAASSRTRCGPPCWTVSPPSPFDCRRT